MSDLNLKEILNAIPKEVALSARQNALTFTAQRGPKTGTPLRMIAFVENENQDAKCST